MKARQISTLEQLFRALADETRLRILALVASGEICVCHIHGALDIPQPTASRHLAYLRRAGLVATRRDGLWVHYRLAVPRDPAVASVLRAAIDALGQARNVGSDRRKLSALVKIPVRVLDDAAACCMSPANERRERTDVKVYPSLEAHDHDDPAYWSALPLDVRVKQAWKLSEEQWRLRGEFPDEPGLCRSVARIQRP